MKKVVIIEDQTAVREMIAQIVRTEPGFEVVAECGDGQTAVETCIEHKPDFVILDVMLPGLNGAEVLRRFSRQLPKTRVLIFSGYQDSVLLRELLEAGAHGFIGKSAPLTELQKGIQVVAGGGSYFSPEVAQILREAMTNPAGVANPAVNRLTTREREILQLIAESYSTKEIANKLKISVKTAENHRTNLMKKLDLHDIASLTRFAIEYGLIEPPVRPTLLGSN
ncbi:MAG: response regulator transcription factor [Verrucomicrobiota bacterium JB022]|nr:response regulator transcription factor [Verrucomicrobiota bacterium JB022]